MKTLPQRALLYTPLAMCFAALHIVTTLTFLKSEAACVIPSALALIILTLIYRLFGFKQSVITAVLATGSLAIFLLACKLAH